MKNKLIEILMAGIMSMLEGVYNGKIKRIMLDNLSGILRGKREILFFWVK